MAIAVAETLDLDEQTTEEAKASSAALAEAEARAALDVTLDAAAFGRALDLVQRAMGGKTTSPILKNVLLVAETGPSGGALADGHLTLTGTDLEIGLRVSVPAAVATAGSYTVPAGLLDSYTHSLDAKVPLRLTGSAAKLTVKSGKSSASIKGIDAEEFPPVPNYDEPTCTIGAGALRRLIDRTAFAIAKDESRPVLHCLNMVIEHGTVLAQAADGFRMTYWPDATTADGLSEDSAPLNLLIPLKGVQTLRKLLPKNDEARIGLVLNENKAQIVFTIPAGADASMGDVTLVLRQMVGQFPDLLRVVPKNTTITVSVFRESLLAATRRAAMFSRDAADVIRLTIDAEGLTLRGEASGVGENEEPVPATVDLGEHDKPSETVGVNSDYLLESVAACPSGEITLAFVGPLSPFLVRDPALDGYVSVLMPMHVVGR